MKRDIQSLGGKTFDVLVIGGGITGACIAHDAALRGLAVALVEKGDFGGFTSSASSKLLHGGIRYLPKAQLWKIRESAREQAILQHVAPHLTQWVPFLIPTRKEAVMQGALALKAAMHIYRGICAGLTGLIRDSGKRPPRARFYQPGELFRRVPFLQGIGGITGAQELWESHMYSSERMVLAFVKTAVHNGAAAANYAEVVELLREGSRVTGALVKDVLTGTSFPVRAALVINAAGPYVQAVNRSVPALHLKKEITGFSRGVHLVARQVEDRYALALTTRQKAEGLITRGGRHFFIIPWRNRSLIGTTNVPFSGSPDDIRVSEKDIEEFLEEINRSVPGLNLARSDVFYAFTGLYPLISRKIKKDTYQGTGDYQIIDHARSDAIDGIVTALGAKYTTARLVAEKTVNLAAGKLPAPSSPCRTVEVRLSEGDIDDLEKFRRRCLEKYSSRLDQDVISHLIRYHGAESDHVVETGLHRNMLTRLHPAAFTLEVEVYLAVAEEMAQTLEDVVFRRTGLGTTGHPGQEALVRSAEIMGDLLGWDAQERERQIAAVNERYRYRSG